MGKSVEILHGPRKKKIIFYYKGEKFTWGYSLTGKTAILHIVILGSSPNISNFLSFKSI
jgi:hypothetical protein